MFLWCTLYLTSILTTASANDSQFSGGMFGHIGAGQVSFENNTLQGVDGGLGGRAAFALSPFFRIGSMGFNSGFDYVSVNGLTGSYVHLKYGGLTLEYVARIQSIHLSAGCLAGGGSVEHLHVRGKVGNDLLVTFAKNGTFIFTPFLLAEIPLTKKISIGILSDWVFGNAIVNGNSYGPRVHLGVLFSR